MAFLDERIQVDHLGVRMEGFQDCLPSNSSRERGHGREECSFRHDC